MIWGSTLVPMPTVCQTVGKKPSWESLGSAEEHFKNSKGMKKHFRASEMIESKRDRKRVYSEMKVLRALLWEK